MDPYLHGIALFNRAAFFEAHEVLEDVWRASSGPEKSFLQGLIQAAVALHHYSKGNIRGARSLLGRALLRLQAYPGQYHGVDLQRLRANLAEWSAALAHDTSVPGLPLIRTLDGYAASESGNCDSTLPR